MRKSWTTLALAGFASASSAAAPSLELLVFASGRTSWSASAMALPGSVVTVGICSRNDPAAFCFSGTFVRIDVTRLTPGDFASIAGVEGRVSPFNSGPAIQAVFACESALCADPEGDKAESAPFGMGVSQRDPMAAGGSNIIAPSAFMYRFSVILSAGGSNHDIDVFIDQVKRRVMTRHAGLGSTSGRVSAD